MKLTSLDLKMRTASGKPFILILVGDTVVIEPFEMDPGFGINELKGSYVTYVAEATLAKKKPIWPTPIEFI